MLSAQRRSVLSALYTGTITDTIGLDKYIALPFLRLYSPMLPALYHRLMRL